MKIYNTLSKTIEEFIPNEKNKVSMYTCGPTVYHYAHIGNLRTYMMEDVLEKILRYSGYNVLRVMNITDVGHLTDEDNDSGEDKMEKGAARDHKSVWDIAEFYLSEFLRDTDALNNLRPTDMPRATDYIQEQIELIQKLEKLNPRR